MKKHIILFGFSLGIFCNCLGLAVRSDNTCTDYNFSNDWRPEAKSIINAAVNPPRVRFSPDTLDGGGLITVYIEIDDPNNNFSSGFITVNSPNGMYTLENYFSYETVEDGRTVVNMEINEYYPPGYWYVNSVYLYYADAEYTFNAADVHSGFYVINTHIDTAPPGVRLLEVSKDTALPGDTVLIRLEIDGTGSGLSSFNFYIFDFSGIRSYYNGFHDYYLENTKIDTLLFFYVIGKYETIGDRRINIEVSDKAGYAGFYTEDSLNFRLVVTGTTEDIQPPVVKNVQVINHSKQGEIWLEVIALDDISGINHFSVSLYSASDCGSYSFNYYPMESLSDFKKINDSLYRCNMLIKDPYLATDNYQLSINLIDNAMNYSYLDNYQSIYINNVNSDTREPEILSVRFDKDTVIAGDSITATIVLSDDKSGLKRIYGSLHHVQTWQSIDFEYDFNEPGILNYTMRKSFMLPEYGRGGLWTIRIMSVYDYSGKEKFDWYTERPAFNYFPKYVDTIPPVFKSCSIEPGEVNAGDTVTVTVLASDNLSGIKKINYSDDYLDSDLLYYMNMNTSWFMSAPDTYKFIIPVNEYAMPGSIAYELGSITDAAGNDLYIGQNGPAYKIISSGEIDTLPPVFDSLYIADTLIDPEDTLTLIFYLHDDKSGIYPGFLFAYFGLNTADQTSYNNDIYDYLDFLVFPKILIDNQYIVILPAHVLDSGLYILSFVFMADMAGNYAFPDDYDYHYLACDYTFRVSESAEKDTDSPLLKDISITPGIAQPGDTVRFEITAVKESSGIPVVSGSIVNSNGVDMHYLYFNDWVITESNDTFKCRTYLVIPKDATNGRWILAYLSMTDYYGNDCSLEYGVDYYHADFMVTGGHAYPNRPPTWVIPQINLTIGAGESLYYRIPEYIVNDIDGDALSFSAVMKNGDPLTQWIHFSPENLDLSFSPDENIKGLYNLYVIASDPNGLSDSIPVNLTIINHNLTNVPFQSDRRIQIYPNPAAGFINIECPYTIKAVNIYDLTGKVICQSNSNFKIINTSAINEGIYIITLETEQGTFIDKILIR